MRARPAAIGIGLSLALTVAAGAQSNDVQVEVQQFGVGSVYRPGDPTALRVTLTALAESDLDEATQVWVQWEVENADGDLAEYGRPLVLTKGRETRVWLYAPLPPEIQTGEPTAVRVFRFEDGERGRELGGTRINPPTPNFVESTTALIGVVGTRTMGLTQLRLPSSARGEVSSASENTRTTAGIRAEDLPDRWEGLKSFDTLAWSDALPQDLQEEQAVALAEWIRRGGHLVITLPEDGNPWGLGTPGQVSLSLEQLLPRAAPRKDEEVPLVELAPIMSKARGVGIDFNVSIRVFKDLRGTFDAIDVPYEPLIALPDGRVVVVQRLFGHGRVTVIGLDLSNQRLANIPLTTGMLAALPQADVFWNRILGRRADTPTSSEIGEIAAAERLSKTAPEEQPVGRGTLFRDQINMSGKASTGLLLALLLFVLYWVVAGPGGFALLKHYDVLRHAWLAFAAAAGVFTALAWSGVSALRSHEINVQHLTFLDRIAQPPSAEADENDPQLQRAASWMTIYLPGYGSTRLSIETTPGQGLLMPDQRDLLLSWAPPGVSVHPFPNVDRYRVDVGEGPNDFEMPTRATATQMYANWLGSNPEWGGHLREDQPIEVTVDASGNETLRGSIINELPGVLENVTVIWIRSRRLADRQYAILDGQEVPWVRLGDSGRMLNQGHMWRLRASFVWEPGVSCPLEVPGRSRLSSNIYERYVKELESRRPLAMGAGVPMDYQSAWLDMEMLCLFDQLTPPKYLREADGPSPESVAARRMLGRELDLSVWFGRPCVIVIGVLRNSACPIPLRVEGEPVSSTGQTIVRWIFPLPLEETLAFDLAGDDPAGEGGPP